MALKSHIKSLCFLAIVSTGFAANDFPTGINTPSIGDTNGQVAATITGSNVTFPGTLTTTGNITTTSGTFVGNGSGLTGLVTTGTQIANGSASVSVSGTGNGNAMNLLFQAPGAYGSLGLTGSGAAATFQTNSNFNIGQEIVNAGYGNAGPVYGLNITGSTSYGTGYLEGKGVVESITNTDPSNTSNHTTQIQFFGSDGQVAAGIIATNAPSTLTLATNNDSQPHLYQALKIDDNQNITFYGAVTVPGSTTLGGALVASSSAPSIATGSGIGTSGSASIVGTNLCGVVTLYTGSAAAASSVVVSCTFSAGMVYPIQSVPQLTPENAASDALSVSGPPYAVGTTNGFTIYSGGTALTSSTTLKYNYWTPGY
jgi:hypothetical protein